MVHGWLTYIDGYGPRRKGAWPGTVSSGKGVTSSPSSVGALPASTASRSALVKIRLTSIPSGVSQWASAATPSSTATAVASVGDASPRRGAVLKSGKVVISLHSQLVEEGGQGGDGIDADPQVAVRAVGYVGIGGEALLGAREVDGRHPGVTERADRAGPLRGVPRVRAAEHGDGGVLAHALVLVGGGHPGVAGLDSSGGEQVAHEGHPRGGLGL